MSLKFSQKFIKLFFETYERNLYFTSMNATRQTWLETFNITTKDEKKQSEMRTNHLGLKLIFNYTRLRKFDRKDS